MNENVSFNLIDEPWILVRGMEGEMREVSLMELFEQAPCIRRLANDLPTQDFAILRVLLAILQRSISPTLDDDDDPAEVWAVSGRRPSFLLPLYVSILTSGTADLTSLTKRSPLCRSLDCGRKETRYQALRK